jgi:hypothetical protein
VAARLPGWEISKDNKSFDELSGVNVSGKFHNENVSSRVTCM